MNHTKPFQPRLHILPCLLLLLAIFCSVPGCATSRSTTDVASPQPPEVKTLTGPGMARAFALGFHELEKEGAPLDPGTFSISFESHVEGSLVAYRMHYKLIPPRMSGDRLLIIIGESVTSIPLF